MENLVPVIEKLNVINTRTLTFTYNINTLYVTIPYNLKVQSWKFYNNIYMMALIQIKNMETFAFIAFANFKLLNCKILLTIRKNFILKYFYFKKAWSSQFC